jgi:hypothetical protein
MFFLGYSFHLYVAKPMQENQDVYLGAKEENASVNGNQYAILYRHNEHAGKPRGKYI